MTPEQEYFEKWFNRRHSQYTWGLCKAPNGDYIYLHAELAWQAWQAALASHAPSEAAAQPTIMGVDLASGPAVTVFTCSKCGCELHGNDNFMEDMYRCPRCMSICKQAVTIAEIEHNDH